MTIQLFMVLGQFLLVIGQLLLILVIYNTHKDHMKKIYLDDEEKKIDDFHSNFYELIKDWEEKGTWYRLYILPYIHYFDDNILDELEKFTQIDRDDKEGIKKQNENVEQGIFDKKMYIKNEKVKITNKLFVLWWSKMNKKKKHKVLRLCFYAISMNQA